jgi:hypothetical protein
MPFFQTPDLGETLKKQFMDLGFIGIGVLVAQTFFHSLTDSRKKSRTSQHPLFLAHGTSLPNFCQQVRPRIIEDDVFHCGTVSAFQKSGKP